ncbi:HCL154Cp [Eremothecium sinecaudum]|uniref:HCL154Cp n=1 Tax=Eremothecium sinecaudum TaxID=45286 RepID=A0A109UYK8_9SACH|nr:HCL154Cp [Eremothecium sinecaudum]AMD19997.1 HCL154Cp [Eremothecium sinecaudum]
MSRTSKIVLAASCLVSAATIMGVHIVQEMERDVLRQGPIKDAKRVAEKKSARERAAAGEVSAAEAEKERKRLFNAAEHQMQLELRKKYDQLQPLSGEIVTKDGEVVDRVHK